MANENKYWFTEHTEEIKLKGLVWFKKTPDTCQMEFLWCKTQSHFQIQFLFWKVFNPANRSSFPCFGWIWIEVKNLFSQKQCFWHKNPQWNCASNIPSKMNTSFLFPHAGICCDRMKLTLSESCKMRQQEKNSFGATHTSAMYDKLNSYATPHPTRHPVVRFP